MNQVLQMIAHQSDELQKKDEYIDILEKIATALGIALLVVTTAFIYLPFKGVMQIEGIQKKKPQQFAAARESKITRKHFSSSLYTRKQENSREW